MEWTGDLSRGAWIEPRLHGWARVGGVAPSGFEAYARVLHPAPADCLGERDERGMPAILEERPMSWAEVAERQGRIMHPLVQWNRLSGGADEGVEWDDGWRVSPPEDGFLDPTLLAALVPALAAATSRPDDVTLGYWNGWAEINGGGITVAAGFQGPPGHTITENELLEAERLIAARTAQLRAGREAAVAPGVREAIADDQLLRLPGRDYVLLRGDLDELSDPSWPLRAGVGWHTAGRGRGIMPQLIWPTDQAWCIASEIDWDSTIVAGPRSLIDAVLANAGVEVFEVQPTDTLSYDGDTINPAPSRDEPDTVTF